MLVLLALLLAAADPSAEFSLDATAGDRGERRAEATAHATSGSFGLTLGAATFDGPQAPQRQEILLGAQAGVLRGELRAVPPSSGLQRLSAELGVHFETLGLVLGGRTASLGRMQLQAASARSELEGDLAEGLRAGLDASLWALQLDAPSSRDPWRAFGEATLDWAQRWETGAWLSIEAGEVLSLTPSLSRWRSRHGRACSRRALRCCWRCRWARSSCAWSPRWRGNGRSCGCSI